MTRNIFNVKGFSKLTISMHSVAFNLKAVAKASACVHNVLCACFLVNVLNYAQISLAEYTIESSKVVIMCAFGAHAFKDLGRSQLAS